MDVMKFVTFCYQVLSFGWKSFILTACVLMLWPLCYILIILVRKDNGCRIFMVVEKTLKQSLFCKKSMPSCTRLIQAALLLPKNRPLTRWYPDPLIWVV